MIEHGFSYLISFYRSKDIELNGQIDINGVKRAKTELFLFNIQFFFACIIIGFTINHFLEEDHSSKFHHRDEVLKNYWIVIDVIIVFLSQTYISAGLYMKVDGEIIKNLFSLHFL